MIGKLTGKVDSVGEDSLIVDVMGVGYEVSCSTRTLTSLPPVGETLTLFVETYVREDQIRLFGFLTEADRSWFRLLQSVQGVGAKVALAILSTHTAIDLANAIAMQDKAMVARAPGIGPKVAQRLVTELKDKIPMSTGAGEAQQSGMSAVGEVPKNAAAVDAVSALTNLGYAAPQASAAIAQAAKQIEGEPKAEDLIRLGLRELAK
ncbi:MAG: Holliday junction branch migration protein RuvA [Methyloligellaceae bacterium]